eukprot:2382959-Alexandrium_andersonii.AAC.1
MCIRDRCNPLLLAREVPGTSLFVHKLPTLGRSENRRLRQSIGGTDHDGNRTDRNEYLPKHAQLD